MPWNMDTQNCQSKENLNHLGTYNMNSTTCQTQGNSGFASCQMSSQRGQPQEISSYLETCDVNAKKQDKTHQQIITYINHYRKLKNTDGKELDVQSFVSWLESKLQESENGLIQPLTDYQIKMLNCAQKFAENQFHENSLPSQQFTNISNGLVNVSPHMTASRVNVPPEVTMNQSSLPSQLHVAGQMNCPPQLTNCGSFPPQWTTNQFNIAPQLGQVGLPQQMSTNQKVFSSHSQLGSVQQQSQDMLQQFNSCNSNPIQPSYQTPRPNTNTFRMNSSVTFESSMNLDQINNSDSCLNRQQKNNWFEQPGNYFIPINNSETVMSSSTSYSMSNSQPVRFPFHENSSSLQAFRTSSEMTVSDVQKPSRNTGNMSSFSMNNEGYDAMRHSHGNCIPVQGGMLQRSNYPSLYANSPHYAPPLHVPNHVQPTVPLYPIKKRRTRVSKKTKHASSSDVMSTNRYGSQSPEILAAQVGDGVFRRKWYSMPKEENSSGNTNLHSNKTDRSASGSQNVNGACTNSSSISETRSSTVEANSSLVNSSNGTKSYPTALVGNEQSVFVPSGSQSSNETLNTNVGDGTCLLQSAADRSVQSSHHCYSVSDIARMSNPHEEKNNGECKNNTSTASSPMSDLPDLINVQLIDSKNFDEKNCSVMDFNSRHSGSPCSSETGETTILPPLIKASAISSEGSKTMSSPLHEANEGNKTTTSSSSVVRGKTLQKTCILQNLKIASNLNSSTNDLKCTKPSIRGTSSDDLPLPVIKYVPRRSSSCVQHVPEDEIKKTCLNIHEMPVQHLMASKVSDGIAKLRNTFRKHFSSITSNPDIVLPSTQKHSEQLSGKQNESYSKYDAEAIETSLTNGDCKTLLESHCAENNVKTSSSSEAKLKRNNKDKASTKTSDFLLKVKLPFQHGMLPKRYTSDNSGADKYSKRKKFHSDLDIEISNGTKKRSHSDLDMSQCYNGTKKKYHGCSTYENSRTCGHLDQEHSTEKHGAMHVHGESNHQNAKDSHKQAFSKKNKFDQYKSRTLSKTSKKGQSGRNTAIDNLTKSSDHQNMDTHEHVCCSLECDTTIKFPGHTELKVVHYHGKSLICLDLPSGKYFVMKEFVAKCLTSIPKVKIYKVKTKILKVKHCELIHNCRKAVIRYLHDGGAHTSTLYLGIILVQYAKKLYHYLQTEDKTTMGKNDSIISNVKNTIRLKKVKTLRVTIAVPLFKNVVNTDCHPDDKLKSKICDRELSPDLTSESSENKEGNALDDQDADDENSSVCSDGTMIYCDGLPINKTNSNETVIFENEKLLSNAGNEAKDVQECAKNTLDSVSSELAVMGGVEIVQNTPIRYVLQGTTKWYLIDDIYPIFGEQELLTLVHSKSVVLENCTDEQCHYFRSSSPETLILGYYLMNQESFHDIMSSIENTYTDGSGDSNNRHCVDHDELSSVSSRRDEILICSDGEGSLSDHDNCCLETPISLSKIHVRLSKNCDDSPDSDGLNRVPDSSGISVGSIAIPVGLLRNCCNCSSEINGLNGACNSCGICVASVESTDTSSITFVASAKTTDGLSQACDDSVRMNDGLLATCSSSARLDDTLLVACDGSSETDDLSINCVNLTDTKVATCDNLPETNKSFGYEDSPCLHDGLSGTDDDATFRKETCASVINNLSGSLIANLLEESHSPKSTDCSHKNSILKNNESCVPCDKVVTETELFSGDNSKPQEPKIILIQDERNFNNVEENDEKRLVQECVVQKTVTDASTCYRAELRRTGENSFAEQDESGHITDNNELIPHFNTEKANKPSSFLGSDGCSGLMSSSVFSQDPSDSHSTIARVDRAIPVCSPRNSISPIHADTATFQTPQESCKNPSDPAQMGSMADKLRLVSETFSGLPRDAIMNSVLHLCETIFHLQNKNRDLNSEVKRISTLNTDLQDGVEHYKRMVKEFALTFKEAEDDD